jgi:hypothetical protein
MSESTSSSSSSAAPAALHNTYLGYLAYLSHNQELHINDFLLSLLPLSPSPLPLSIWLPQVHNTPLFHIKSKNSNYCICIYNTCVDNRKSYTLCAYDFLLTTKKEQ